MGQRCVTSFRRRFDLALGRLTRARNVCSMLQVATDPKTAIAQKPAFAIIDWQTDSSIFNLSLPPSSGHEILIALSVLRAAIACAIASAGSRPRSALMLLHDRLCADAVPISSNSSGELSVSRLSASIYQPKRNERSLSCDGASYGAVATAGSDAGPSTAKVT